MSISSLVSSRVSRMKRGLPFSIESFYALGSTTAVQKAMSRLAEEGKVARLAKGIYARPKPLPSIPSIKIAAKAEDVALTWAKSNQYKITPQGAEAAYQLGMQTQAPVKSVFWSNGPAREFRVGNQVVTVKNTTEQKLLWINKPEGQLYRALLTLSPEHTSMDKVHTAIKRLNLTVAESISVIRKLKLQPLMQRWRSKLEQLERALLS